MPGFEAFELLRPTDDTDVFFVYTRWRSTEDFESWLNSQAFQHGHTRSTAKQGPVGTGSELLVVRRGAGRDARRDGRSRDPSRNSRGPGRAVRDRRRGRPRASRRRSTSSACGRCASSWRRTRRAPTSTGSCRAIGGSRSASTTAVRARARAQSLAELGVERGDRVALVSANVPEWVIMFWACAMLGATLVPLNAWWKAEELEFGLTDSGAEGADRRRAPHRDDRARPARRDPRRSSTSS